MPKRNTPTPDIIRIRLVFLSFALILKFWGQSCISAFVVGLFSRDFEHAIVSQGLQVLSHSNRSRRAIVAPFQFRQSRQVEMQNAEEERRASDSRGLRRYTTRAGKRAAKHIACGTGTAVVRYAQHEQLEFWAKEGHHLRCLAALRARILCNRIRNYARVFTARSMRFCKWAV